MGTLKNGVLRAAAALREVLVIAPLRFYQKFLSPLKPACCRFTPTCSSYAITAIRRFGALRGSLMACCRVLRCNPWCRPGYDPVPSRFTLRPFAGREEQKEKARCADTIVEENRRCQ